MNHPQPHPLQWRAPQPWWRAGAAPAEAAAATRPQILRFATDDFIEQLLATLAREPMSLPALTAQHENWRRPHAGPQPDPAVWLDRKPARLLPLQRARQARALLGSGLPALPQAPSELHPVKLYQPAHQRHYLIAGALVCRTAGLPDRAIDAARQHTGFVLRRILPEQQFKPDGSLDTRLPLPVPTSLADWREHAWVIDGSGQGGWVGVPPGSTGPLPGEERLPTFPARYTDLQGQPRRLHIGSVPVGRRETYQAATLAGSREPAPADPAAGAAQSRRQAQLMQLKVEVLAPWAALVNQARDLDMKPALQIYVRDAFGDSGQFTGNRSDWNKVDPVQLAALRDRLQQSSWFILLDLRRWLADHVPDYLAWLDGLAAYTLAARPPGTAPAALHALLQRVSSSALRDPPLPLPPADQETLAIDLPDALRRIGGSRDGISHAERLDQALTGAPERASRPFESASGTASGSERERWPDFLFLLVDPWHDIAPPLTETEAPPADAGDFASEKFQKRILDLSDALPPDVLASDSAVPAAGLAALQPADMRDAWYVMRMVHERPDCAPFEGSVTSAPTVPFQLAGFFDPDAPARPIRIGLPVDISPAGLRKFDRNTVFMMSDMLCGHLDRFRGITFGDLVLSVLPWPFHKDLDVPAKGPCRDGGNPLGVMCSLSIPIITICALILLTIVVSLLDFIFRWLPLFVVCLPVPGFKGRKEP